MLWSIRKKKNTQTSQSVYQDMLLKFIDLTREQQLDVIAEPATTECNMENGAKQDMSIRWKALDRLTVRVCVM